MSAVAVIGTGYVGLTTAVCLAELGHRVTGVDIDKAKMARLRSGEPTIYEPGLDELMAKALERGRLAQDRCEQTDLAFGTSGFTESTDY